MQAEARASAAVFAVISDSQLKVCQNRDRRHCVAAYHSYSMLVLALWADIQADMHKIKQITLAH